MATPTVSWRWEDKEDSVFFLNYYADHKCYFYMKREKLYQDGWDKILTEEEGEAVRKENNLILSEKGKENE